MTENFDVAKTDFSKGEKHNRIYNSEPVQMLLAVLGVNPVISVINDVVSVKIRGKLHDIQNERLMKILEVIMSDNKITTGILADIEPVKAFAKMFNAVNRLLKNDKLEYFANLYKSLVLEENRDYNQFEEYLERLESLSYRELQVLFLLHKNELSYHDEAELLKERETQKKIREKGREGKGPNAPYISDCNEKPSEHYNQTIVCKWKKFNEEVVKTYNIDSDILQSLFLGISKSGFCMQFKEMSMYSEKMYYVTKYYENFYNAIKEKM